MSISQSNTVYHDFRHKSHMKRKTLSRAGIEPTSPWMSGHAASMVASMVYWLSRPTSVRGDVGSIPARDNMFFFSCEVCVESHVTQC